MIHYNSLWETMSNKHFTTYTLREKHNIGHGTVQRLQKNMPVSTYTLDRLCKILDCRLDEVAEYLPDEEADQPVSTHTLNKLCEILNCRLDEVAEYVPDDVD